MKVMVWGIGNDLNGDDGVGPYVARRLREMGMDAHDCGTVPENCLGYVRRERPDILIMVDAASMGLPPGSVRRVSLKGMVNTTYTTHAIPIRMMQTLLQRYAGEILVVGVEPESTEFGTPLSDSVKEAAERVVQIISQGRWNEIPPLEG